MQQYNGNMYYSAEMLNAWQNSALTTGATTGRQATPVTAADMTAPTLRPAVTQQTTIQAVNQPPRATVYPTITSYATQDARHHNVAQSRLQYNPMYSRYPNSGTPAALNTFPIHPDVTFKNLPFFEHISDLIKPSSLVPQTTQRMQETSFTFHLTPSQATDIASNRDVRPGAKLDYIYQVQLRFCVLETSSEQDDFFPPGVSVKVNNKVCPLPNPIPTNKPGVEPKRPPKPVNITHMVKLSPTVANHVQIGWAADFGKGYVIRVSLVQKMTASELLNKLRNKGIKHADHTTGLIKEKLNEDADCEIATTSLRVSLLCPLGKFRMSVPCRASTCNHLQCFDAQVYLEMNERRATWTCPVCDKPALFENLTIDGYFQDVLVSPKLTSSVTEIELHKDGSWIAHVAVKKEVLNTSVVTKDDAVEIIGDDIEVIPITSVSAASVITNNIGNKTDATKPEQSKLPVVDLTLSDSDDDDLPLKRKCTTQRNDSAKRRMDTASISSASSRNTVTPGPSSVSSSDHQSPSVIMLSDSPSPPRE